MCRSGTPSDRLRIPARRVRAARRHRGASVPRSHGRDAAAAQRAGDGSRRRPAPAPVTCSNSRAASEARPCASYTSARLKCVSGDRGRSASDRSAMGARLLPATPRGAGPSPGCCGPREIGHGLQRALELRARFVPAPAPQGATDRGCCWLPGSRAAARARARNAARRLRVRPRASARAEIVLGLRVARRDAQARLEVAARCSSSAPWSRSQAPSAFSTYQLSRVTAKRVAEQRAAVSPHTDLDEGRRGERATATPLAAAAAVRS